jgi:hypothetical protein
LLVLGGLGAWWLAARLVAPVGLARVLEVTLFRRLVAGTAACGGLAIGALVTVRAPRWLPSMVALELLVAGWGLTPVCRAGLLDPAPLRAWLGAPAGRVLIKDPPRGWGFYAPPTGLALPPNLASAALWRDVGGYDSLALAGTRQRLNLAARGAPTSPAINGNMLLLGEVEALPPGTTLTVDGGRPWPVITPPRAPGQVVHDGANRVTLTGVSGQQTLYDTAYPGWRLLGADGRRLPWTGTVGGPRVWTLAAPELVRWVFAPLTVRLGLFLSLVGWALAIGCALGPRGERG